MTINKTPSTNPVVAKQPEPLAEPPQVASVNPDEKTLDNDGVYEPHYGLQDNPADGLADFDTSKKRAATLADGTTQDDHVTRPVARTAESSPKPAGIKVNE